MPSLTPNTADLFEDPTVRERFLSHYDDLRGQVREAIIRRHLLAVVLEAAPSPLRILDVGCGDGRECLWLAGLGHEVVGIDPADGMLSKARELATGAAPDGTLRFERGNISDALATYGESSFDLVLSHGVLMYQDEPAEFIAQHIRLLRENGVLSLLAKNVEALAHRAAREVSVDEAIRLLDDSQGVGHLGFITGAQSIQELAEMGFAAGATVRSWAGVRMFSDSPGEPLLNDDQNKVIELEWLAARRDPHRRTAALVHALLLRGIDLSLLPK